MIKLAHNNLVRVVKATLATHARCLNVEAEVRHVRLSSVFRQLRGGGSGSTGSSIGSVRSGILILALSDVGSKEASGVSLMDDPEKLGCG